MRHRSLADGRGSSRPRLLALAVLTLFAAGPAGAAEPPAPDTAFLRDHCTTCHNEEDKRGRLDLAHLPFDPKDSANLAVWVKVHDRVTAGDMPPKSCPRPDAARQKAFVEGVARSVVAAERAALAGEGRAVLRRLNRQEYENALRDLLGVPWAEVANRLPEDGEAYRFNKSGEALDVSYLQLAHSTTNLPTLFAGGGFRHGQHLAFGRGRDYPLPNLFVSMLQRMGLEEASFGPSTGTMRGLEMV